MITLYQISTAAISAAIIGILAIIKGFGINTKWIPLIGVALGVLAMLGVSYFESTATVIFTGIAIGLSALGLYDVGDKGKEIIASIFKK